MGPEDSKEKVRISHGMAQLVSGATIPLRAWGRFFLDPTTTDDQELRAQAFSIYFCSLYDIFEASERGLPRLVDEARQKGFDTLGMNGEILAVKAQFAGKLLSLVSTDLQLTVRYARDQWVHGFLNNYSQRNVKVKLVKDLRIDSKEFSWDEFQSRFSESVRSHGGIGQALSQAAKIMVSHPKWIMEIDTLSSDPGEVAEALMKDCILLPFSTRNNEA
ncbi:hypothetical protein Ga0609869_003232 [Rhodovulum iodosum]|uniref:Uncharacterized protein n=1 Tax=Rhodovulum iodosum TaxID=68291 RepID=A0ABV3XXJ2_9RHOB|nr:hypothetical protein [Rhodovulum robiginosum]RSK34087.1 hypothetical protein EJA01_08130 [Rhodovulum robiginosum]